MQLCETRRPDSSKISSRGFTNNWSRKGYGTRLKGVAIGISNRLQPSVVEVIPVDEHILQFRLRHILGFISLVAAYISTEMCEADEMFYAKLNYVLHQWLR